MKNFSLVSSVLVACTLAFSGCGSSGSSGNGQKEDFNGTRVTLDATAGGAFATANNPKNRYTYFDFSKNLEVNESDSWDIAFKRYNVILNGGSSGDGNVTGAVADLQSELYSENGERINNAIIKLNENIGLVEFNKADSNVTVFIEDANGNVIQKEWWRDFNKANMTISANENNWMIVKSSTGNSYAKVHATSVTSTNRKLTNLQLEMYFQGEGENEFAGVTQSINIDLNETVSTKYYDFDSNTLVDESGSWDLKIDNDFKIWLNSKVYGGGEGGVFGRTSGWEYDQLTNMLTKNGANDGGANTPLFLYDESAGIFEQYSWYEKKVDGGNKYWSLYRTYIVKVSESEKYKVQIINYYNNDPKPVSGHITMRYEKID